VDPGFHVRIVCREAETAPGIAYICLITISHDISSARQVPTCIRGRLARCCQDCPMIFKSAFTLKMINSLLSSVLPDILCQNKY
jgi:hypothetical protein